MILLDAAHHDDDDDDSVVVVVVVGAHAMFLLVTAAKATGIRCRCCCCCCRCTFTLLRIALLVLKRAWIALTPAAAAVVVQARQQPRLVRFLGRSRQATVKAVCTAVACRFTWPHAWEAQMLDMWLCILLASSAVVADS